MELFNDHHLYFYMVRLGEIPSEHLEWRLWYCRKSTVVEDSNEVDVPVRWVPVLETPPVYGTTSFVSILSHR